MAALMACAVPDGYRLVHMQLAPTMLAAAWLAAGCATLPKADALIESVPVDGVPAFASGNGLLTLAEGRRLLNRAAGPTNVTDRFQRHFLVMQDVGGSPLFTGNAVTLLPDVAGTCRAMLDAMRTAREHIHLEMYIFRNDATGREFRDVLVQKHREGVAVRILYDSVGCSHTPRAFFRTLRNAGVELAAFNPVLAPRGLPAIAHRDHSKLLIVDGRVAFVGGVNIRDATSRRPHEEEHDRPERVPWSDADIRVEGPAAMGFQRVFLDTWRSQRGPEPAGATLFPALPDLGHDLVMVVEDERNDRRRGTFIMYLSAMAAADRSIHLISPYFAPDPQTRAALMAAARRGVEVKLILPGVSDHASALYAGQYVCSELMQAGVKVYRRRGALLHAKMAVIDGVWSTVGSSNLDYWSLLRNREVNAVILSRDFADRLEREFQRNVEQSEPLDLESWRRRPVLPRVRAWLAHWVSYWL